MVWSLRQGSDVRPLCRETSAAMTAMCGPLFLLSSAVALIASPMRPILQLQKALKWTPNTFFLAEES